MTKYLFLFAVACLIERTWSIPIDNGVDGDPEIECGANAVVVNVNVRNVFEGKVYVRGHATEQGCFNEERGRRVAGLTLPFTACGISRSRSLNPKGVFVTASIVVSFHPQFLTKVDRAYTIQCFYMEADKTVSQQIEVSELSTLFQSQVAPMPVCRYDILDNGPTGQPVKFATIGQQVYHKWTCDSETTDVFCIIIHSCFVEDGVSNRVQILDDNGCALDKHILQNLEYTTDLMAGREAHTFRFADNAGLFFHCQITIGTKEAGQPCARPQCQEPTGIKGPEPGSALSQPRPTTSVQQSSTQKATSAPVVVTTARLAGSPVPVKLSPALQAALRNRTKFRYYDQPFARSSNETKAKRDAPLMDDILGVWDVRAQQITTFEVDEPDNPFQNQTVRSSGLHPSTSDVEYANRFCLSPPIFGFLIALACTMALVTCLLSLVYCRTVSKKSNHV